MNLEKIGSPLIKEVPMRKFLFTFIFIIVFAVPATAQQVLSIASIVNDEVISRYDVNARIHLMINTSGLKDTPAVRKRLKIQVLNALIDEKLKMQEMERLNLDISKAEIEGTISLIEKQNRIPAGRLRQIVKQIGLKQETLEAQIKSDIAWRKVVNRTLKRSVQVGNDEIEERLEKLKASQGKPKMLVSEIFLPVEDISRDKEVYESSKRLIEQIREGASFRMLARQFSQSATAAKSGDLEWVFQGQLEEELDETLALMKAGDVSKPVRMLDGYYILYLRKRRDAASTQGDTIYTLSQLFLSNKAEISVDRNALMQKSATTNGSCEKFNGLAKEFNLPNSGAIGDIKQRNLPPVIMEAIKDLPLEVSSKIVPMEHGDAIFMVCGKTKTSGLPSKEQIKNRITAERLELLARRHLRELRRAAVIDIRQ